MSEIDNLDALSLTEERGDEELAFVCALCMQSNEKGEKETWMSISILQDAADQGCEFHCALHLGLKLYAEKHKLKPPSNWGVDSDSTFYYIAFGEDYFELRMFPIPDENGRGPAHLRVHRRHVLADSSSEPVRLVTKNWLEDCLREHKLCVSNASAVRPARLIDVGLRSDQIVTLVTCTDLTHPYMTLSYCWGSALPVKTTTATLHEHREGIPLPLLPRTIRDAVEVVRYLGHRYLWIDALCIVQDDLSDWEEEAAKMAGIYQGSVLTICAAVGPDCESGLFHKRYFWDGANPAPDDVHVKNLGNVEQAATAFTYTDKGGNKLKYHIGPMFDHECQALSPKRYGTSFFKRAWIFQECFLSPRKLFFLRSEMVWSCSEKDLCECGDVEAVDVSLPLIRSKDMFAQSPEHSSQAASFPPYAVPFPLGRVNTQKLAQLDSWYNLVIPFTERLLTNSNDILPAFSGIAKRYQKQHHGSYLAGIWEAHLPLGLLWFPLWKSSSPERVIRRYGDAAYQLPSWSWSSFTEGISSMGITLKETTYVETEILEAECHLAGRDPTGEIRSGFIILRGPTLVCELGPRQESSSARVTFSLRADAIGHIQLCVKLGAEERSNVDAIEDTTIADQILEPSAPAVLSLQADATDDSFSGEGGLPSRFLVAFLYTNSSDVQHSSQKNNTKQGFGHRFRTSSQPSGLALVQSTRDPSAYERIGLCTALYDLDTEEWAAFDAAVEIRDIKIV